MSAMPAPRPNGPCIEVRFRYRGEQEWRSAPPVRPSDIPGSAKVFHSGHVRTVLFGWRDGVPMLWRTDGVAFEFGGARVVVAVDESGHVRLGDQPVQMTGPEGHWRWWAVT